MNKSLLALCGVAMVDQIGFGIVLPLLPFYAQQLHANAFQITLIIASFPAAQLLASPVLGRLSDRVGRRWLLIGGLLASAVSYFIFSQAHSLGLLLFSRFAAGAAGSTFAVAQAYVADVTTAEKRTAGMGWLGSAFGVGLMVGPAIGGIFAPYGLSLPGLIAASLCALNALAAVFVLRSPTRAGGDVKVKPPTLTEWIRAYANPPLNYLVAIYVLTISTFEAVSAVLTIYLAQGAGLTPRGAGALWAWSGLLTIVVRAGLVGMIVKRTGETRLIQLGLAALIGAMVLLPFVRNLGEAFGTSTLLAVGSGFIFPPLASLTSKAARATAQGAVLGGVQLLAGVGRVVGPLWAGAAFVSLGSTTPFWIACCIFASALAIALASPAPAAAPVPG